LASDPVDRHDTKLYTSYDLWDKALHDMSQDKDRRELLDEYKKAVVSELKGDNLAGLRSSIRDITAQEVVDWLNSKISEQTTKLTGRGLAGSAAKAVSSITKILSPASNGNPYIGLACAGLCILTLVC
jgi:hypothetical protein